MAAALGKESLAKADTNDVKFEEEDEIE
jgi:hypothetical protein